MLCFQEIRNKYKTGQRNTLYTLFIHLHQSWIGMERNISSLGEAMQNSLAEHVPISHLLAFKLKEIKRLSGPTRWLFLKNS